MKIEQDKPIKRKGDVPGTFLELTLSHDGDVYFAVKGQDTRGQFHEVQIEFIAPNGGGYHPNTISALHDLAKAMKEDNNDPECPQRYKEY